MKTTQSRRYVGFVAICLLLLAASVSAQERESGHRTGEPKLWNASFVYGATTFRESARHRTLGTTFRVRLASRLSVESEFRYMSLPSHESSTRRSTHSDLMAAGHVVYDFRDEATKRVIPYVMGGIGWVQTRDESTYTPIVVESSVPVFPAQPPPQPSTYKDVTNWLWFGGTFGVRVMIPRGFFVAPEVSLGGSKYGDITASAVIKMGYGF